MITQEEAKSLIDTAIKYGVRKKVDGIEATIDASNVSTSRFANNGMTQNQSPDTVRISVRVQNGGKQARLSTDVLTPAGLKALVDNAVTAASLLEPDKDMLPMPAPEQRGTVRSVNRFDATTAEFTPQQRADAIAKMVGIAKERGLISAGVMSTGAEVTAIGNSQGLFRYHRQTTAEASVTMKHVDHETHSESTGWAKAQSPRVADISVDAMAKSAADKAIASANPVELPPGKYTVILEPAAVLDLLGYLWYQFSGTSHIDKLSCFLNKVGQQVLGQNINVTDDAYHALQSGAPFDGEGMQRQVVHLIEHGVVSQLVHGRRSAKEMGVPATGHGLAEPSPEGEVPENIVMAGGTASLDDMIRNSDRAILLTRVWYVREVDPTKMIVTGMTRDGTFLVENGAIKSGIKNFRFNEGLIAMLNNVQALGPSVRTAAAEGGSNVVPAMKVSDFNFASVTRF
jgi:predicted Zn-dependent protease